MFLATRLHLCIVCYLLFLVLGDSAHAEQWQLDSPNKVLRLSLRYEQDRGLEYQLVLEQNQPIVEWSKLGLEISWPELSAESSRKQIGFDQELTFLARVDSSIDESYTMLHGKSTQNNYAANEARFLFQHRSSSKQLRIDIQLADDGVALRYVLPETSGLSHWISEEATEINFASNVSQWAQAYETSADKRTSYEAPYLHQEAQDDESTSQQDSWSMPSLFRDDNDFWVLIHESNLTDQYHGSHLRALGDGNFKIAGPSADSVKNLGHTYAVSKLPALLPWRFLIVSRDLADIVESNRVFDLATASKIANTDWIQAGVASSSWQPENSKPLRSRKLRQFIDLSAQMQWPYSLIDVGRQELGDEALEKLVSYADKRSVGLGISYHSGGKGNVAVANTSYVMSDPERRKAEFKTLQSLGIRYIKVDSFDGDKQIMIQHYLDILKDAAQHQLMVVFNGSTVPRGWARTYPNLMTMEAVRGGKYYSIDSEPNYTELAIYQNTILPFTRNAIGSMDFAPVAFSNQEIENLSSHAHQAALAVIFESGLQHLADDPASYRKAGGAYQEFLQNLPSSWEQTKLLSGYPGKDIVIARRAGNTWYVAGINGERTIKQLEVQLDFLPSSFHRDLAKSATLISDANNPKNFNSRAFELGASSKLRVKVAPAGGFVMMIKLDQEALLVE